MRTFAVTLTPANELRALADQIESREGTSLRLTRESTRRVAAALRFYADAIEQPRNDASLYQVEIWGPNDSVIEIMAATPNAIVGIAAFEAAKEARPTSRMTLRKGMHLVRDYAPAKAEP